MKQLAAVVLFLGLTASMTQFGLNVLYLEPPWAVLAAGCLAAALVSAVAEPSRMRRICRQDGKLPRKVVTCRDAALVKSQLSKLKGRRAELQPVMFVLLLIPGITVALVYFSAWYVAIPMGTGLAAGAMWGLLGLATRREYRARALWRQVETTTIERHQWEGCTCAQCGQVRDEGHEWRRCVCIRCRKAAPQHEWADGCTCRQCGARVHTWNGCTCTSCGERRATGHVWEADICQLCGASRRLVVPTVSAEEAKALARAKKQPEYRARYKATKHINDASGQMCTYDMYEADTKVDALGFLEAVQVTKPLYHVVVETLDGCWGKNQLGVYTYKPDSAHTPQPAELVPSHASVRNG